MDPFNYIGQGKQVIIPSLKFNGSGHIAAFHLSGTCGGGEQGVQPVEYMNTTQDCINILQVWRPSGGTRLGNGHSQFSIAANFTATLMVTHNTPVTTSVAVNESIPFSSGDVLGFTPGPRFYFQVANTPNQQPALHMYYTYDSFETELRTTASNNRASSSPIISVEGEHVTHPMKYSPYT